MRTVDTARGSHLTAIPTAATLGMLYHTRRSEASTFQKVSEQTFFIHEYLAALENRRVKTAMGLSHVKKKYTNMSVVVKPVIFSLNLCR